MKNQKQKIKKPNTLYYKFFPKIDEYDVFITSFVFMLISIEIIFSILRSGLDDIGFYVISFLSILFGVIFFFNYHMVRSKTEPSDNYKSNVVGISVILTILYSLLTLLIMVYTTEFRFFDKIFFIYIFIRYVLNFMYFRINSHIGLKTSDRYQLGNANGFFVIILAVIMIFCYLIAPLFVTNIFLMKGIFTYFIATMLKGFFHLEDYKMNRLVNKYFYKDNKLYVKKK